MRGAMNHGGVIPRLNAARSSEPAPRAGQPCSCPTVTDWEPGHQRITYTQHAADCPVGQALYEGGNQ